jgi:hypothetical protein
MREPSRDESLDTLLVRIEQLWREHADKESVHDLIRLHPEFSGELRDFYADLVGSDDAVGAEVQAADESVYQWLRTSGIDEALAAAAQLRRQVASPTTRGASTEGRHGSSEGRGAQSQDDTETQSQPWLAFLGKRLGRKKADLAASLPNVTLEFLSLVSRHPRLVPDQVKNALSRSVQEHLGVPAEESLEHLSGPDIVLRRAASRREPGGGPPETFEQLLERAALGPAAKAFWRERAQRLD